VLSGEGMSLNKNSLHLQRLFYPRSIAVVGASPNMGGGKIPFFQTFMHLLESPLSSLWSPFLTKQRMMIPALRS
jgi:hypothetical protein